MIFHAKKITRLTEIKAELAILIPREETMRGTRVVGEWACVAERVSEGACRKREKERRGESDLGREHCLVEFYAFVRGLH